MAGRQVTVGDFRAGPKEIEYVTKVLASGRLSYGPYSRQFEEMWAEAHNCKHAVFCNSGTSALQIAVQALKLKHGWRDGDEILIPSVTFVATANVVLHNNLKPVFVDVDPYTYNIDHTKIREKITPYTRAIIPVHLTGLPANMPGITLETLGKYPIIEDSCETAFAKVDGDSVGSWGDIGCFSTYMAHYIVTGVGGLCTTDDSKLAASLRSLMNHGRDGIYLSIDDDNGLDKARMKEVISRRFKFETCGHSFRCTEIEAALGVAQMERRHQIVKDRTAIAAKYMAGLRGLEDVLQLPTIPPGHEHVFMMFPLVMRAGEKSDLVNHLEEHGIETRDLLPLLGQPVYREMFGDLLPKYPVAANLDRNAFYIGCHQYITDDDIDHVLNAFYAYYQRPRK